jgi:RimJ/RimL family protein N-acetyltransferase
MSLIVPKRDVELTDGVLRLRAYTAEDAPALFAAVTDSKAELVPWFPWCHAGYQQSETEAWLALQAQEWERGTAYALALCDPRTGGLWGGTGLNFIDPMFCRANLGYWIRTEATGRRLAARAARLMALWALSELGFARIEIVVDEHNVRSQRVAQRVGATCEGRLRCRLGRPGTDGDAIGYSLVRADVPALQDLFAEK